MKDYLRNIEQGTSQEIDKDGNQVNIIKGDHYNIVSGKRQESVIEGNADITMGETT